LFRLDVTQQFVALGHAFTSGSTSSTLVSSGCTLLQRHLRVVLPSMRIPVAFDRRFRRHSISRSDNIRSAIPTIRSPVPTT
jgi:hypothetical protein